MKLIARLLRDESGQDMVEYALLVSFGAFGAAASLPAAVEPLREIWELVIDTVAVVAAL